MEDDDGAIAGVTPHDAADALGREVAVVVARDDIPKNDRVVPLQVPQLRPFDASVGWAHQGAADVAIGLGHIVDIGLAAGAKTFQMVHGVVAHMVAAPLQFGEQFGKFAHIVAHAKKGGFHAIAVENIEQLRCRFGAGAVVESEVNLAFTSHFAPPKTVPNPAHNYRWLFDEHLFQYESVKVYKVCKVCKVCKVESV